MPDLDLAAIDQLVKTGRQRLAASTTMTKTVTRPAGTVTPHATPDDHDETDAVLVKSINTAIDKVNREWRKANARSECSKHEHEGRPRSLDGSSNTTTRTPHSTRCSHSTGKDCRSPNG